MWNNASVDRWMLDETLVSSPPHTHLQAGDVTSGNLVGSVPIGQRFNYLFYVDFVGSLTEVHCQNALRHLQVCKGCGRVACIASQPTAYRREGDTPVSSAEDSVRSKTCRTELPQHM
jgi:hypothetical protein